MKKKILSRIFSGLKFFVVIMAIAVTDSLVIHYFIGQINRIKSEYIVEAALSYHQEFIPYLEEILASRQQASRLASQQVRKPPPSPTPDISHTTYPISHTPTPPPTISEADLYAALSTYRTSHGRTHLVLEENLCVYARRRVNQLQKFGSLDAHAGFQKDADSGEVFKITNMNAVAENLAYLPAYATATQIVEWGWDTSTAHRDAQLSNDWTHVCLSGKYPFYVGIFGRR